MIKVLIIGIFVSSVCPMMKNSSKLLLFILVSVVYTQLGLCQGDYYLSEEQKTRIRNLITRKELDSALIDVEIIMKIVELSPDSKIWLLRNKSSILNTKALYSESISCSKEIISIPGLADTIKAEQYYNLGILYWRLGQLRNATESTLKAKEYYANIYGKEHREHIKCLNSLGQFAKEQSKLKEAERIFIEAKKLNFKLSHGQDMQYARIINNLADVYTSLHKFDKAEDLYKASILIKEKQGYKNTPDIAKTQFNLSKFYNSLGKHTYALDQLTFALDNYKKDSTSQEYLKFLDLKAILLHKTGSVYEAESLLQRLIQKREELNLKESADYALSLMNLATFYLEQNYPDSTIHYAHCAIKAFLKLKSADHVNYASMLTTLADAEAMVNKEQEATEHYEQAELIYKSNLGREHIDYFTNQFHYARMLRQQGDISKAKKIYKDIDHIPKNYIKKVSKYLSEHEIQSVIEVFRKYHEEIYSFNYQFPDDSDLSKLAYDNILFYKGHILNNLVKIRQKLSVVDNIVELKEELLSSNQQLEVLKRNSPEDIEAQKRIQIETENLESKINSSLKDLGEEEYNYNWIELQGILKSDDAAIEIVEFHEAKNVKYGALILRPMWDSPRFIRLCDEPILANLIQPGSVQWPTYIASIYNYQKRSFVEIQQKKYSLYDLIWKPLDSLLNSVNTVYFSPAGLLHRISIPAIPVQINKIISDLVDLRIMNSTKSILEWEKNLVLNSGNNCLLIGGLKYDSEETRNANQNIYWPYLPWTDAEINGIQDICKLQKFESIVLKDYNADERSLDSIINSEKEGFKFVHISTHGYFKKSYDSTLIASRGISQSSNEIGSGLILSLANERYTAQSPINDGIWNSKEISQSDLKNTELVVLSACETGLGDIKIHEGVYGLQRAFKISGARYLIMSLWQIPDQETHEFMLKFYDLYLNKKFEIRKAFQLTQQEMRNRFINPEQWAGFVLIE